MRSCKAVRNGHGWPNFRLDSHLRKSHVPLALHLPLALALYLALTVKNATGKKIIASWRLRARFDIDGGSCCDVAQADL
jgi:hypothetical protein